MNINKYEWSWVIYLFINFERANVVLTYTVDCFFVYSCLSIFFTLDSSPFVIVLIIFPYFVYCYHLHLFHQHPEDEHYNRHWRYLISITFAFLFVFFLSASLSFTLNSLKEYSWSKSSLAFTGRGHCNG